MYEYLSIICPACHDLFIPENGKIPIHYLDTYDNTTECPGSGQQASTK